MYFRLKTPLRKGGALAASVLLMGFIFVEVGWLQISEIYRIRAMNAVNAKEYGVAEEFMLAALAIDKSNEMLYIDLGNIYHAISQQSSTPLEALNKSRQAYLSVIERNPFYAKAWFGLARNRERIHLSSYKEVLYDGPGNLPESEADNQAWTGETENYFKQAISQDPNNVFYMMNYLSFLLRIVRYDEAKKVYRQAYKIAPDVINRYYFLQTLLKNREFNRIVEENFWEEISRNPKNLSLYHYLGRWYVLQELYAHALAVYRKAQYTTPAQELLSQDQKFWVPRLERQIKNVERLMRRKKR